MFSNYVDACHKLSPGKRLLLGLVATPLLAVATVVTGAVAFANTQVAADSSSAYQNLVGAEDAGCLIVMLAASCGALKSAKVAIKGYDN